VEKGVDMNYEAPVLVDAGSASDLVQAYLGPRTDGNGYINSQLCATLTEDE